MTSINLTNTIITCDPLKLENTTNIQILKQMKEAENRFLTLFNKAFKDFTSEHHCIDQEVQIEWKKLSDQFKDLKNGFAIKRGLRESMAASQILVFSSELRQKTNFILGKKIGYKNVPKIVNFEGESERQISQEYGKGILGYYDTLKKEVSLLRKSQFKMITALNRNRLKNLESHISSFVKEIFKTQNAVNQFRKLVNEVEVSSCEDLLLRAIIRMDDILTVSKGIVVWQLRIVEGSKLEVAKEETKRV